MDEMFKALADFFCSLRDHPTKTNIKPVPLRDVEALWNSAEHGACLVFLP